jgi:hypothetical protein
VFGPGAGCRCSRPATGAPSQQHDPAPESQDADASRHVESQRRPREGRSRQPADFRKDRCGVHDEDVKQPGDGNALRDQDGEAQQDRHARADRKLPQFAEGLSHSLEGRERSCRCVRQGDRGCRGSGRVDPEVEAEKHANAADHARSGHQPARTFRAGIRHGTHDQQQRAKPAEQRRIPGVAKTPPRLQPDHRDGEGDDRHALDSEPYRPPPHHQSEQRLDEDVVGTKHDHRLAKEPKQPRGHPDLSRWMRVPEVLERDLAQQNAIRADQGQALIVKARYLSDPDAQEHQPGQGGEHEHQRSPADRRAFRTVTREDSLGRVPHRAGPEKRLHAITQGAGI